MSTPLEVLDEYAHALQFSATGRARLPDVLRARNELAAVIEEMRTRRVNGGRNTSPTLIAWAGRLGQLP